jgi:hypothetical protein
LAAESCGILVDFLAGMDRLDGISHFVDERYSVDLLQDNFSVIALGGNLAFFAIQVLLTRRLEAHGFRYV